MNAASCAENCSDPAMSLHAKVMMVAVLPADREQEVHLAASRLIAAVTISCVLQQDTGARPCCQLWKD